MDVRDAAFLIVEDDPSVGATVARVLCGFGTTRHVGCLAQAERALESPGLWMGLVVDVRLPDGSGLDFLVRAREAGVRAPALVTTDTVDDRHVNTAFDLDASYLRKPFERGRLESFARRCILQRGRSPEQWNAVARAWQVAHGLTVTETKIFRRALEGTHRGELVDAYGITETTFKRHVHNLLRKTGDPSLLAAVQRGLRDVLRYAM